MATKIVRFIMNKKETYAKIFQKTILKRADDRCSENHKDNYCKALNRLKAYCHNNEQEAEKLLRQIIEVLHKSRITINFNSLNFDFLNLLKKRELLNCFHFSDKPNEVSGYNIGRDSIETSTFELTKLNMSRYQSYALTKGFSLSKKPLNKDFHPYSRPIYAALDFLNHQHGGAQQYGKSFFVLKDYVKQICTFSPFDTYGNRFQGDINKLCTYFSFENLIANCQNDFFGYNCLKSLIYKARNINFAIHNNYGTGAEGNYIECHIHGQILIERDIKHIFLSKRELNEMYLKKNITIILNLISEMNSKFPKTDGLDFIILIND